MRNLLAAANRLDSAAASLLDVWCGLGACMAPSVGMFARNLRISERRRCDNCSNQLALLTSVRVISCQPNWIGDSAGLAADWQPLCIVSSLQLAAEISALAQVPGADRVCGVNWFCADS
jgi:hypothetical protein